MLGLARSPERQAGPVWGGPVAELGWTLVPPTAAVAGSWLWGLLVKVGYLQKVCKVTCLTYCAKFGIEPFHRRVLGYYSQSGEKVMHI